jgi:hypothetical protein
VDSTVLNFDVFSNRSELCDSIRNPSTSANATGCPYGPGQVAVGVQIPLGSGYPLTSLYTRLLLLDTSNPSRQLACIDIPTTPYYPRFKAYGIILWVPAGITIGYALLTWFARIWAATTAARADREAILATSLTARLGPGSIRERVAPIFWEVVSGVGLQRSGSLVRFTTPSARDVFHAAQWATSLGMVAANWPGFMCALSGFYLTQLERKLLNGFI